MYKKGGHINFPIVYKDDDIKEELSCIPFHVNEISKIEDFFNKLEKSGKYNDDNNKIKYNEIYEQLFPFYHFNRFINEQCFYNKDVKFILNDLNGNFILCNPLLIEDNSDIHVFQMTNKMQVKYNGTTKYKTSMYYNFNNFEEDCWQYENIYYNIHDLRIIEEKQILNYIGTIDKFYIGTIDKLKLISNDYYAVVGENLVFHENFNIIIFMTFTNKIDEFFKLYDYCYINYNNNIEFIFPEPKNEMTIRNNLFDSKKELNGYKTDDSKNDYVYKSLANNDKLFEFINSISETKKISELINDLSYMCVNLKINNETIYDKLLKNNDTSNILKIIKINKMLKDTNFFNDDYDTVINAYMYVDISSLFHNKQTIQNKRVISRMNASVNLHQYNFYLFIANFFDVMEELFVKCKDTNFNNTYQDFIKTMISGCYYEYLKKNSEILPFSLKTHKDKYKLKSKFNSEIPEYVKNKNNVIKLKQHIIKVGNEHFNSCGESSLLNLLVYILFDNKNDIFEKNIKLFHEKFPENKLKDIFNWNKLKEKTENQLTLYFNDNIELFGNIIANIETENELYSRKTKKLQCEIMLSFKNAVFIMQNIFKNPLYEINYDDPMKFFKQFTDLFNKGDFTINNTANAIYIKYSNVEFKFTNDHGYVKVNDNKTFNFKIFNKIIRHINCKKNEFIFGYGINYCRGNIIHMVDVFDVQIKKTSEIIGLFNAPNCIELVLSDNYDIPFIENTFNNCKYLTLGAYYTNKFVENTFINCIHLTLGLSYNEQFVENTFVSCTHLTLGKEYKQLFIPNTFNNCTHITFDPSKEYEKIFKINTFISNCTHIKNLSNAKTKKIKKNIFIKCKIVSFHADFYKLNSRYGDDEEEYIEDNAFPECIEADFSKCSNQINIFNKNAFPICTNFSFSENFNFKINDTSLEGCTDLQLDVNFDFDKYLSIDFVKKLNNFTITEGEKKIYKLIENKELNIENINILISSKKNYFEQLLSQPINPEISTFYKNKYAKYSKKLKLISFI